MSMMNKEMRDFLIKGWVKSNGRYYLMGKYEKWVKSHDPTEWSYHPGTESYILSEELETLFVLRWS